MAILNYQRVCEKKQNLSQSPSAGAGIFTNIALSLSEAISIN